MFKGASTDHRCSLLELPAEVRELIWVHAVTSWAPTPPPSNSGRRDERAAPLLKAPIRMDRFNRPAPPPLTQTSHQVRSETLHLYYANNVFEFWRPLAWLDDWSTSTLIVWLRILGPDKIQWLERLILLYKHEDELSRDIIRELGQLGFQLRPGLIEDRQELTEFEMMHEVLGLPRHFGRKQRIH